MYTFHPDAEGHQCTTILLPFHYPTPKLINCRALPPSETIDQPFETSTYDSTQKEDALATATDAATDTPSDIVTRSPEISTMLVPYGLSTSDDLIILPTNLYTLSDLAPDVTPNYSPLLETLQPSSHSLINVQLHLYQEVYCNPPPSKYDVNDMIMLSFAISLLSSIAVQIWRKAITRWTPHHAGHDDTAPRTNTKRRVGSHSSTGLRSPLRQPHPNTNKNRANEVTQTQTYQTGRGRRQLDRRHADEDSTVEDIRIYTTPELIGMEEGRSGARAVRSRGNEWDPTTGRRNAIAEAGTDEPYAADTEYLYVPVYDIETGINLSERTRDQHSNDAAVESGSNESPAGSRYRSGDYSRILQDQRFRATDNNGSRANDRQRQPFNENEYDGISSGFSRAQAHLDTSQARRRNSYTRRRFGHGDSSNEAESPRTQNRMHNSTRSDALHVLRPSSTRHQRPEINDLPPSPTRLSETDDANTSPNRSVYSVWELRRRMLEGEPYDPLRE